MSRYIVRQTTWGYDIIDTHRSHPRKPYYIARGLTLREAMVECMQLNGAL
jgi:hypothetical protein